MSDSPQVSSPVDVDVLVLGAGSFGENVASSLLSAGRSVVVVEQRFVGGECGYVACVPSKALLHAAHLRRRARRAQTLGAAGRALDLDEARAAWENAVARRDTASFHRDDSDSAESVRDEGAVLLRGHGEVTGPGRATVATDDGEVEVRFTDLVVGTGSVPSVPPVDGLDAVEVWTSDEALSSPELPRRLVVMGGGPVGCEMSQIYASFGVAVTLVEGSDRLQSKEAAFVGETLAAVLRADGVDVRLGVRAERAERTDDGLRLTLDDGSTVEGDRVLVATGRTPTTQGLGLERVDVELDDSGAVVVDDRCRAAEHVWAGGDVTGVFPFTHTAKHHATVVAAQMTGTDRRADVGHVPRTMWTEPQVTCCGLTPEQAEEQGLEVVTAGMDVGSTGRAWTERWSDDGVLRDDDRPAGRVELYADPGRGVLVGAAAVGPDADSWMGEVVLAVKAQVPVAVLADVVHAFPAWNEVLDPPLAELVDALGVQPGLPEHTRSPEPAQEAA